MLLHGAGASSASLGALRAALEARGVDAVAWDLPGRGDRPGAPLASMTDLAEWVRERLWDEHPEGAVLLGHSMGGGVAIETALTTDAPVRGLVLVATGARLRVHPDLLAAPIVQPEVLPDVAAVDWRTVDRFDRLTDVADLAVPVLVAVGSEDVFTPPRYASHLADLVPGARLHVEEGATHGLPQERPDQLASVIGAFVRDLPDQQVCSPSG